MLHHITVHTFLCSLREPRSGTVIYFLYQGFVTLVTLSSKYTFLPQNSFSCLK